MPSRDPKALYVR